MFYGFGENLSSKQCPAVSTVLGLEEGKECVIVGTVYKHMKLKPTILDEYSKEVIHQTHISSTICMLISDFGVLGLD